ncbi:hypothetical protein SAMN05444955_11261 [Lihuaxuella thermophila]|uniref:Uncharacterized protein n=1 Tax=Lihuaxuella thermophila TaxID=1173111 RepID=A0A1H8GTI6_9BACL|nr:hypothetical protein SAMN05444955_11261 [Lihuaxuella thermophila]
MFILYLKLAKLRKRAKRNKQPAGKVNNPCQV